MMTSSSFQACASSLRAARRCLRPSTSQFSRVRFHSPGTSFPTCATRARSFQCSCDSCVYLARVHARGLPARRRVFRLTHHACPIVTKTCLQFSYFFLEQELTGDDDERGRGVPKGRPASQMGGALYLLYGCARLRIGRREGA